MPANPEYQVRRSLLRFTQEFQARLRSKVFLSAWGKIAETFRIKVIDLKPRYRVMPEGFAIDRPISSGASDRDSVFSANNSPSLSVKRNRQVFDLTNDSVSTPSAQRRRGENGAIKVEDLNGSFAADVPAQTPGYVPGPPSDAGGRVPSKTLAQIRNLIRSEREAGKPGEVPYDVIEKLCVEAVTTWEGPLHKFLDHTMTQLRRELDSSLNESFK